MNSYLNQFVKSCGYEVSSRHLKSLREYVKVDPYRHEQIANFYGGERIDQINFELVTN